jgi:hypothetical protein
MPAVSNAGVERWMLAVNEQCFSAVLINSYVDISEV